MEYRLSNGCSQLSNTRFIKINLKKKSLTVILILFLVLDKAMQLNQARFRLNANNGYVLKPDYMLVERDSLPSNWIEETLSVSMTIIGGRHVGRPGRNGISNPFVVVEVYGAEYDSGLKLNTRTIRMFIFVL